jgi:2-phosphoglycerate kinase
MSKSWPSKAMAARRHLWRKAKRHGEMAGIIIGGENGVKLSIADISVNKYRENRESVISNEEIAGIWRNIENQWRHRLSVNSTRSIVA